MISCLKGELFHKSLEKVTILVNGMISCLKGELFHKSLEKVTILVNGVGYEVFLSTLRGIPVNGQS
jgi:Holliday junction resolvasome RuvABC DNA-binding subunit